MMQRKKLRGSNSSPRDNNQPSPRTSLSVSMKESRKRPPKDQTANNTMQNLVISDPILRESTDYDDEDDEEFEEDEEFNS
jgi:hypothetical protein